MWSSLSWSNVIFGRYSQSIVALGTLVRLISLSLLTRMAKSSLILTFDKLKFTIAIVDTTAYLYLNFCDNNFNITITKTNVQISNSLLQLLEIALEGCSLSLWKSSSHSIEIPFRNFSIYVVPYPILMCDVCSRANSHASNFFQQCVIDLRVSSQQTLWSYSLS